MEKVTDEDIQIEDHNRYPELYKAYDGHDLGFQRECELEKNRATIARAIFYLIGLSHGIWQVYIYHSFLILDICTFIVPTYLVKRRKYIHFR